MQNDTRIAVDLAKAVFEVAASDRQGRVARRERLPRSQFLPFFAQRPATTVVMKACGYRSLLGWVSSSPWEPATWSRPLFAEACCEIRDIEARIKHVERQLEAMAQQLPVVAHLLTIPGIGLLTATALFALIGNIHRFPSGRHLASWLGLTHNKAAVAVANKLARLIWARRFA